MRDNHYNMETGGRFATPHTERRCEGCRRPLTVIELGGNDARATMWHCGHCGVRSWTVEEREVDRTTALTHLLGRSLQQRAG